MLAAAALASRRGRSEVSASNLFVLVAACRLARFGQSKGLSERRALKLAGMSMSVVRYQRTR
jgi:hypothetical protein